MNKPKNTILKNLSILSFICSSFLSFGQWAELHPGLDQKAVWIDCVDANNCIAGGSTWGEIFKTTDGGQSWTHLNLFGTWGIYQLKMFHPDTIYASLGFRFFKTIDGGNTWIQPTLSTIEHWYFINPDIGYGLQGTEVVKTTDGGTNWTSAGWALLTGMHLNKLYFLDELNGFGIGGNGSTHYIYTTAGAYWDTIYESNEAFSDIQMVTPYIGYACGKNGLLVKTINGGASWNQLANPAQGNRDLRALDFINTNSGYVVGDSTILKTIDGGNTWISESQNAFSVITDVKVVDLQTAYIAPNYGDKVLKNSQANLVIEVLEHEMAIGKIYPNPTSDYLNVELQKAGCSIQILDQNGKIIQENRLKDHEVTSLNLSEMKSGLYLYRISDANGGINYGKFTKL